MATDPMTSAAPRFIDVPCPTCGVAKWENCQGSEPGAGYLAGTTEPHPARVEAARATTSGALRMAYADPPYLGCCGLYDHEHGTDGRCWDDPETHRQLIDALCDEYPEGWALSASSPSILTLAPMLPRDVRTGVWIKTFCAFKKGVRPAYAWEPVFFWRGRNPRRFPHAPPAKGGKQNTPKDFCVVEDSLVIAEPITLRKGFTGAKPERVCEWILDLLNVQEGDEFTDIYPGTGVMGRVAATVTNPDKTGDENVA